MMPSAFALVRLSGSSYFSPVVVVVVVALYRAVVNLSESISTESNVDL